MRTLALLGSLVLLGCASRPGLTPQPFPSPADRSSPPWAGSAVTARVLQTALELRGVPYRNAGSDPDRGFDCSGFVQYVFAHHGVSLPRGVREQYEQGAAIGRDALQTSDLVFFSTVSPGASHVGIVVDDEMFVHSPSDGGRVRLDRLHSAYWAGRYIGARRVLLP